MADSSPAIANEFIRRGLAGEQPFTQMQLQRLVYIANGWNLAINGSPLTVDSPEALHYGPVYDLLRVALIRYGTRPVTREIRFCDFSSDDSELEVVAKLDKIEMPVIERVFKVYGRFHSYQLSALTIQNNAPWADVYNGGAGEYRQIPSEMIRQQFIDIVHKKHDEKAA